MAPANSGSTSGSSPATFRLQLIGDEFSFLLVQPTPNLLHLSASSDHRFLPGSPPRPLPRYPSLPQPTIRLASLLLHNWFCPVLSQQDGIQAGRPSHHGSLFLLLWDPHEEHKKLSIFITRHERGLSTKYTASIAAIPASPRSTSSCGWLGGNTRGPSERQRRPIWN